MSEIDISKVLGQMRAMAAQAPAINKVNEVQMDAGRMTDSFESGDPQTDLTQVMISLQKASVSFQAMTQVRNKLVDAYQDIMNMPV
jgi:flagellar hook-basal body complex protein FliE